MKSKVLKGSIILVIAGLIGKLLGAIYRIPLSNILGAEGIGVYQMIFPIFSLALILSSGGVSTTLAHSIAKAKASGEGNVKQLFFKGFFYSLILGVFFGVLFVFLGKEIAQLQGNILAENGYKIAGISIIFASLLAPLRGLFQGEQNMLPTALSQILEQVFKVVFGLCFALLFINQGISFGVVGAFIGITFAEIIAFLYLFLRFLLKKPLKNENYSKTIPFFKINFPITLSVLIIPLLTALDSFLVINLLSKNFSNQYATSLYGLQSGLVNSLINFPVVVSVAISISLLPSLSYILSAKNFELAKEKLNKVFNFLWIFLTPCIVLFITLAPTIMSFLYNNVDENLLSISSTLLQVSAVQILFISLLQVCTAVYQSMDKQNTPIYFMLIGGVLKILLTIILISNPTINIYGLAISNFAFYALSSCLSLYFLKKQFPISLPLKNFFITILLLAILSVGFYWIDNNILNFYEKISFICVFGLIFYILPIILFDLLNLKLKLMKTFFKRKIKNE